MISGKVRSKEEHLDKGNKINLLKFAAVFGANASGKSNLVKSMEFAQATILTEVPASAINDYCRINKENKSLPSSFEFEIKLGGKYYAYGFEVIVSESSIVEEWLYEIGPDMAEHEIFSRDTKKKEIKFGKDFDIPVLQTYADSMKSNDTVLFLTEMNRNKEDIYLKDPSLSPFQEIYRWFEQRLSINYPDNPVSPIPYYIENEKNLDEANRIISSLGLGISRCQIVERLFHPIF
ncbi:MAG: AAA family ATPase [Candidatus Thermoplasmatota archaeon]|nr:AAA family ATPase [Candidatus Thermoplasmatota archaeon]